MAQSLNLEVIPKIEGNIAEYEDTIIPSFRSVAANAVEVAEATELPNLIKSAKECAEGAEAMVKIFEEVVELLRTYVDKYKKIGEATGAL